MDLEYIFVEQGIDVMHFLARNHLSVQSFPSSVQVNWGPAKQSDVFEAWGEGTTLRPAGENTQPCCTHWYKWRYFDIYDELLCACEQYEIIPIRFLQVLPLTMRIYIDMLLFSQEPEESEW